MIIIGAIAIGLVILWLTCLTLQAGKENDELRMRLLAEDVQARKRG